MKILATLVILFCLHFSEAQKTQAYQIYTSGGKKTTYEKMAKKTKLADFVFFGEYHDNPIDHWLQYELLVDLHSEHGDSLVLAFEMFEQDQQEILTSYVSGNLETKAFEDSIRLWPNYKTDYKPLVEYTRANKLKAIASNTPRRYASILFKQGMEALDSLPSSEKQWIVPLDFKIDTTLSQYAQLAEMSMHGMGDFVQAQAIKDATMAHFSLANMEDGDMLYHVNGAYHSDYHQSIIWYVRQVKTNANIVSISTVSQDDVSKLAEDNMDRADFIICVNSNMTSTH